MPRTAQGILVLKRVVVIRSCSPPAKVASRYGQATLAAERAARSAVVRTSLRVERAELARLEFALDLGVDLELARVGIGVTQLPGAQPAQLEDLQHQHEVHARRQGEREA